MIRRRMRRRSTVLDLRVSEDKLPDTRESLKVEVCCSRASQHSSLPSFHCMGICPCLCHPRHPCLLLPCFHRFIVWVFVLVFVIQGIRVYSLSLSSTASVSVSLSLSSTASISTPRVAQDRDFASGLRIALVRIILQLLSCVHMCFCVRGSHDMTKTKLVHMHTTDIQT